MGFFNLNTWKGLAVTGAAVTGVAATACWFYLKKSREEKMRAIRREPECPVCLNDLTVDNTTVLPCGHGFCYSCIDSWVDEFQKPLCPVCRQTFKLHIMLRHLYLDARHCAYLAEKLIAVDTDMSI